MNKKIVFGLVMLIAASLLFAQLSIARIDLTDSSTGDGGTTITNNNYYNWSNVSYDQGLNTTENVTHWNITAAGYFIGDGSLLTGIAGGFTYSDWFNQNLNTTADVEHNNITGVFFGDGGNLTNLSNYANTFTISPSGADYTSIQSALDANPTPSTVFLVYPGTYTDTINFTANKQVVQSIGHVQNVIVQQTDAEVVNTSNYNGTLIKFLNIKLTAPTTDQNMISVGNGFLGCLSCKLRLNTTQNIAGSSQPHIVNVYGSGLYKQKYGEIEYLHTGDTGNGIKTPYDITGTGGKIEVLRPCKSNITNSGTATATTYAVSNVAGNFEIVGICEGVVKDTDANIVAGLGYIGGGGSEEISYCHMNIYGGNSGNAYAIYHAGTGTIRSFHNSFHVETTGGDAHSFLVGASATLISQFDDLIGPDGSVGAGKLIMVSSESDGDLTLTGNLTADNNITTENITVNNNMTIENGVNSWNIYVDGNGTLVWEMDG